MHKVFNKLFNRISITVFFILIELLAVVGIVRSFDHYVPILGLLSFTVSVLVVLYLIRRDQASSIKIVWIIIILLVPGFGGLLYLLVGTQNPVRKMEAKIERAHQEIMPYLKQDRIVLDHLEEKDKRFLGTVKNLINGSHYPLYEDTQVEYFEFGEIMYAAMLEEVAKAERYIFLEYFIINEKSRMWQDLLKLLVEKAKVGVDVRLIYDDFGSLTTFHLKNIAELRKSGIKVVNFNPFIPALAVKMNNRDHRKILVVDDKVAFNGGINIADEYINEENRFGIWKDTGLRIKGPAIASFTMMFLETWNAFCQPQEVLLDFAAYSYKGESFEKQGFVQPFAENPLTHDLLAEDTYIDILNQATDYVSIFTPYLIITDKMIHALQLASKRGVKVTIITPGIPDKPLIYRVTRSFYRVLMKAGVEIYEYSPGFVHAKSFVADDKIAVVGTINLDYRSLYLHFECATLLYNVPMIKELKRDMEQTLLSCRKVEREEIKRHFIGSIIDDVLQLFSPLM